MKINEPTKGVAATGHTLFAMVDIANQRERVWEDARDKAFGYTIPRCPVCNAQQIHPILKRVCAVCGAVIT